MAPAQRFELQYLAPHVIEPPEAPSSAVEPSDARDEATAGYEKREEQRRTLEVLVRTARTEQDRRDFERLLDELAPELGPMQPLPAAVEDLEDWWDVIGSRATSLTFEPKRLFVWPELPWIEDPADLQRLSRLLCPQRDSQCGAESRTFLLEAEARMASFTRLQVAEDALEADESPRSYDDRIAECEHLALEDESQSAFWRWKECVEAIVPQVTRVPRNRFRMPERGILVTDQYGYWEPCRQMSAYSIETGLLLNRTHCSSHGTSRARWRAARVDVAAVRRIALFAALLDDMNDSPARPESFAIPPSLTFENTHSLRGLGLRGVDSHALRLEYHMSGVLTSPLEDKLDVDWEDEPKRQLLAQLFTALGRSGKPLCIRQKDQPLVEHLSREMQAVASLNQEEVAGALAEVRCN
ncbi:MAG TPA: hypothetical protein VM686_17215 [Polyangiaceae bacterium]|nr:hypothetical protein [Polyangiaceae bacterium]